MNVPMLPPPLAVEGELCGSGFFLEGNPFKVGSMRYVEIDDGATLDDYAEAAAKLLPPGYKGYLQIWIGEHRVPPANWALVRPKPTATVYVRVRPQGKGAKNILRAVLMIALVAVAVYFLGPASGFITTTLGLTGTAAAAASAALVGLATLVGQLVINALIPPPGLSNSQGKNDPRYQLTGSNNRFAPYAPIPRLFGKMKVYPLVAARPYTENVGKHQYLRILLLVGWGPIKISDIRIGNSPISAFRNVEYEIHEGGPPGWAGNDTITLYNREVTEQVLNIELLHNVAAAFQTTAFNCVEIGVDIAFPYGLIEFEADGDQDTATSRHKIEYRVAGSGGAWTAAPLEDDASTRVESGGILVSKEKSKEGVRHTARFKVPEGQYEVRVTRQDVVKQTAGDGDDQWVDKSFWACLRSYSTDAPVVQDNICLIAIRMQASEQLNGVPDTISCVAESYLPVYGIGSEEITNGDFAVGTGWTLGAGWAISSGKLNATTSSANAEQGSLGLVLNHRYLVTLTVTRSAGSFKVRLGNSAADNSPAVDINASGSYQFVMTASSIATDSLAFVPTGFTGTIDDVSVKDLDANTNWTYTLTQSPAWAFADLLRRRAGETYLADSRIDLPAIQSWALECAQVAPNANEPRWTFNGVLEGGSVFDALRQVAAIGRAAYVMRDGKHSVVRDKEQATPVQHITPANSWGYSGTRSFLDLPHGLKIEFQNKDLDYLVDERIVYADGYDENNATRFEVLQLFGATSPELVYREGRYHIAIGELRPEEHRVSMDIENLRCTLGDRVQLSHDVIKVGLGFGRITGLVTSGSDTIGFELDNAVPFDGDTYQLRVRHSDGTTSIRTVTAAGLGNYTTVDCAAEPTANGPEVGDLFMFGVTGMESLPAIVKRIEPGDDLSAVLTLSPYDAAIYTADTGTIPAFTSYLNTDFDRTAPEEPSVVLRSDVTAVDVTSTGTVIRLAVDITAPPSSRIPIEGYEVRYRLDGAEDWTQWGALWPFGTMTVFIAPVVVANVYEVSVRAKGVNGLYSDWVQPADHTVVGNSKVPLLPTGTSVVGTATGNLAKWTNPANSDLRGVQLWVNKLNNFTGAIKVGETLTGQYLHQPVAPGDTHYYWLVSVNTSGLSSSPLAIGSVHTPEISDGTGGDSYIEPVTGDGWLMERWVKFTNLS